MPRTPLTPDPVVAGLPQTAPDDEHNRRLVERVHPPGWEHPTPPERYDLVVVGGGTAGLVTAIGAAGLGARVALVERDLLGGDCLNVGCVPSKALLRSARARAAAGDAARFGVRSQGPVEVDFGAVMERVRRVRADLSKSDSAERLRELGVDLYFGAGRFVDRAALAVGDRTLRFKRACVATGSRPVVPPVPGLADAGFLTNDTVFSLTELPARLGVLGGGPIGCELAQAFARLGAEVHLIELADGLLGREDREAAALVEEALRRDGVVLHLGAGLERVDAAEGEKVLALGGPASQRITVDALLVGVGRVPNVEELGLEAAGVQVEKRGIVVDDFLRTTNRRVYAAGDVCLPEKFTHTADAAARLVIRNALFHGRGRKSKLTIPWCTYTDPEVAHVGLYEQEARDAGWDVETFTVPLAEVDRAVIDGETAGFVKVHARRRGGRILGATVVSTHAGETIAELAVAMATGVTLGKLAEVIHCYPTQSEAVRKAADAFNRTRLTPWTRRLLRWLLALNR